MDILDQEWEATTKEFFFQKSTIVPKGKQRVPIINVSMSQEMLKTFSLFNISSSLNSPE